MRCRLRIAGNELRSPRALYAIYTSAKGGWTYWPWEALIDVSKHCEQGALKYGERNCEKGIPIHSLIDSAFRHLAKYTIGETDEPHLRAAAWNILFALYMELKHPEMQDIPARCQAKAP